MAELDFEVYICIEWINLTPKPPERDAKLCMTPRPGCNGSPDSCLLSVL